VESVREKSSAGLLCSREKILTVLMLDKTASVISVCPELDIGSLF